jgi:drug/metabolite transporter (DMT)-like permease
MNTTIVSIVLGIGGMFGWGIYDFLGGVFARQIGPFKSFFWSQLAGLVSILLLTFVFAANINISTLTIILSAVAAIIYAAGIFVFLQGL